MLHLIFIPDLPTIRLIITDIEKKCIITFYYQQIPSTHRRFFKSFFDENKHKIDTFVIIMFNVTKKEDGTIQIKITIAITSQVHCVPQKFWRRFWCNRHSKSYSICSLLVIDKVEIFSKNTLIYQKLVHTMSSITLIYRSCWIIHKSCANKSNQYVKQ